MENFQQKVYGLMSTDDNKFFHSYRGDQSKNLREYFENLAYVYGGKLIWYSLSKISIRMTYLFENKFANYLFRNELIKINHEYSTTGWPESTHLDINFQGVYIKTPEKPINEIQNF